MAPTRLFQLFATAFAFASTLLVAAPAGAFDTPPAANAEASPEASARLPRPRVQAALKDYRRWLDVIAQRHDVAGLATAVVQGDKVLFEHTVGYADVASGQPVTPHTVFRLASLSKAFATAVTGLLVDDGRLHWNTRLVDVLPYFKLKDADGAEHATVGDILGQRLGLPRNTYDNLLEDEVPYEELVRKLDEVDLSCAVGKCYGYQNVAFSMIQDVLFARTGQFFYQLVDKRLFYPLGLVDASYGLAGLESSKSWARPHSRAGRGWKPFEPNEIYYRIAPAAGVNASIRDMEKWLIAQMGGRPDVLPPNLLEVLHAPGVVTPGELHATAWRQRRLTAAHYALGWRVYRYADQTLLFHAGAVAGYRTVIAFLPKYRIGLVILVNSTGPMAGQLIPMVLDDLLGLPHVDWAGIDRKR